MKKTDILKLVLVLIAIYCISSWWMKNAGQIDLETLVEGEIYFTDQIQEKEIKYTLWEQNSLKSYLVILPSMYNDSTIDMEVHYNDKYYKMYIDGELYEDGKSWENIRGEQIYNLKVQDIWGRTCLERPIQFLISQSLPVMMVTVEAKEALYDLQEYSNKQYVEKGNAVMFDEKGMLLIDKKLEKISVRGNTSADLPKKPFRIEFAEEIGLCGMEPAREWNLIANYKDETHIRNKLMLDWADELGEGYNVEGEYLELYVNGEYQGLYLLTETVTVGENRLELEADNSIFAEMELYYRAPEEKNYIVTERSHYWVIHSEAKLSEEKLTDITNWFNEVESALYSEKRYRK